MADNVAVTPGTGATVAADDIAGVLHQRVKLSLGADGSAVDAVAGAGSVGTGVQRVTLGSDDPAVTSLAVMDDWDESDRAKVNLIVGQAGVAAGAGSVGATVIRVTHASDDPVTTSVQLLDDVVVTDDAAFTPATTKVLMVGAQLDNSSPDSVDEGDAGALRMSANRNLFVNIRDAAGNERGLNIDASGNLTANVTGTVTVGSHAVTNAGTFVVQENGAALTALQLIDNLVLAEDAAHVSGDVGVQALAVRNDSDASLAGTSGDYTPLQVDANGYLKVNIKAGAGSGGTAMTDDAAYTAATTSFTPVGGIVTSDSVDSGDGGAFAMLANRQQKVTLYDSSGVELAVGGGTQYDEDTAHTSGDKLTMAGVVRRDTAASSSGTDGDRSTLNVDATGRLWCNVSNTVTVTGAVTTSGAVADGDADSGNPVKMGAIYESSLPTYTTGDRANLHVDVNGALLVNPGQLSSSTDSVAVTGGAAHDAAVSGNPILVAGYASAAAPTDVSGDGDAARLWTLRSGALAAQPTFAGVLAVAGNGASGTGVQRVTLANDSTGVIATVGAVTAITNALPAGTNAIGKLASNSGVTIGAVELAAAQTLATVTTCSTLTGSGVAHDAADSGNPHKIGAKATTALSGLTLVSDADRTNVFAGVDGVLITRPHSNLEDIVSGRAAITDGSSTSVVASQGAGVKFYLTTVIISNTSATEVTVDLRDGAAGTVKATFPAPANNGGCVTNLPVPLPFSAATAVCADPSAAASTVTVTLVGFKSKV